MNYEKAIPLVTAAALFLSGSAIVKYADPPQREYPAPEVISTPMPRRVVEMVIEVERPENPWNVPLWDSELEALYESCEEAGIAPELALAVMEQESGYDRNAVSPSDCYGLMQLNPIYFPSGLTPEDNIREGVKFLGELVGRYDTLEAAIQSYHDGHDTGNRWYANAVLERMDKMNEEVNP